MVQVKPLLASALFLLLTACASTGPHSTVAVIGDQTITLREFEELYAKNNGGWEKAVASTVEDRERFLDLIVRFRLKVKEAKERGLLSDPAVVEELETYQSSIAASYLVEKELVEPAVRDMYSRRTEEVRVRHILFRVDQNASPEDSLAAYDNAMKVLGLLDSLSFDSLAVMHSQDPSASANRGDIGYFSVGRVVPEFEDAAYALKVGEYTKRPVRTAFGYHLIQLLDRRPAKGQIRISHILRRNAADTDAAVTRDSAWAIYHEIRNGMPFEQAVERFSHDARTAGTGGDIGYYTSDRLPPEIANLLYTTPVGGITEPITVEYGYHIFKVTEAQPLPTMAELEQELRQLYQQSRFQSEYEQYLHNLKKQYRFRYEVETLHALTQAFDSTATPSSEGWKDRLDPAMPGRPLFAFGNTTVRVEEVLAQFATNPEFMHTTLTPSNVERITGRAVELRLLAEHAKDLESRHPTLAALMEEYRDGVLLFRIEQDEVWNKVEVADSLLRPYYEETKARFRWPDRVNVQLIRVLREEQAKNAYQRILDGEDFGDVAAEITLPVSDREKRGVVGLEQVEGDDLMKIAWSMEVDSVAPPFRPIDEWLILKVLEKDSARVKTFEEALPEVTSHYREYAAKLREAAWLDELTKKFGVTLNRKVLTEAFRENHAGSP